MVKDKHREAVSLMGENAKEALRFIRNAIIGNPTRKDYYLFKLDLAPRLVEYLKGNDEISIEIATVVCSLAHGSQEHVKMLIDAGIIAPLFDTLYSQNQKLVEAGARALRAILQQQIPDYPTPTVKALYIKNLVHLVMMPQQDNQKVNIAEVASGVLGRLVENKENRHLLSGLDIVSILADWMVPSYNVYPKMQEAALDCLSCLCKDNPQISQQVAQYTNKLGERFIHVLFSFVRDTRQMIRLSALTCITYIFKTGSLPQDLSPKIMTMLLPTVIRLFGEPGSINSETINKNTFQLDKACTVFAILVQDNAELQNAAVEGDAISRTASIIQCLSPLLSQELQTPKMLQANQHNIRLLTSCLNAVSSIASNTEDARRQVIEQKLLPDIISGLKFVDTAVRVAACKCCRSLSRSVKNLRTSLMDAGLAQPLFDLLYDYDLEVKITASATLCNIILDFSPMKQVVIGQGGVKRLVELLRDPHTTLRLNAVWALKNMLFQTEYAIKVAVVQELTWNGLLSLLNDSELQIQEQSMCLLRNLACGSVRDIEFVFNGLGEHHLLSLLETKMNASTEILVQALYVLVNIGIGNMIHKEAIMKHQPILDKIMQNLHHSSPLVRVASIWCIINLTWVEDPGAERRIAILKDTGVVQKLEYLVENDDTADVRDRAKAALLNVTNPPSIV
ncbi:armadillo-type protein [Gorgonomyces haynaldii]|nr:armadillo-type protein [Gorgonomyces haynaldii]